MIEIERQERQPSIQKLRQLLGTLPPPRQRGEEEWKGVQDAVFAELDAAGGGGRARVLERAFAFRSFAHPLIAAAAVLVLVVNGIVLFRNNLLLPQDKLVGSSILDARGNVTLGGRRGGGETLLPGTKEFSVGRGRWFQTGDDGAMTVQLVEGTGFRLSPNSRLEVVEASPDNIRLLLRHGDVIFSVRSLDPKGRFAVLTPNAACSVLGTIFQVTVNPGQGPSDARTGLAVYEGTVRIADKEIQRVATSVETGHQVSLHNHAFEDVFSAPAREAAIRDVSLLKLALELARDTAAAPAGLIQFISEPTEARVVLDGRVVGVTPLVARYPAGAHDVIMSLDGCETWRGRVTVETMRTSIVSARLRSAPAGRLSASQARSPHKRRQAAPATDGQNKAEETQGFVNRPEYVEALIQITVGEYGKALASLEKLRREPGLTPHDHARIMHQISLCYRSLGDFRRALRALRREYRRTPDPITKANLLWEMAIVKLNCLNDYRGAQEELNLYLETYPDGSWADEAREKLEEISLLLQATDG